MSYNFVTSLFSFLLSVPIVWISSPFMIISNASGDTDLNHACSSTSDAYPKNTASSNNLKNIFSDLQSNTSSNHGFRNTSLGDESDRVHGLSLCRGDVTSFGCDQCLEDAIKSLVVFCPNATRGIYWRENCFVKYSNRTFFGEIDRENNFSMRNPDEYRWENKTTIVGLLGNLTGNATGRMTGGDNHMFSYGNTEDGGLYGMVQCTRDLSAENCTSCIDDAVEKLPLYNDTRYLFIGARVVTGSCSVRYEKYDFKAKMLN